MPMLANYLVGHFATDDGLVRLSDGSPVAEAALDARYLDAASERVFGVPVAKLGSAQLEESGLRIYENVLDVNFDASSSALRFAAVYARLSNSIIYSPGHYLIFPPDSLDKAAQKKEDARTP